MPGEDGFSFLRRLRGAGGAKAEIPAIALTAFTRAEDAELSQDAGYGWHLKKPATADQLTTAVVWLPDTPEHPLRLTLVWPVDGAPWRTAGDRYTANSYRRAIHRACDQAFPAPAEIAA